MSEQKNTYKWIVMILAGLSIAAVSYTQFQITASTLVPVLFEHLGIGPVEFSALTTSSMLVGVAFSIIGGVIADKIGPKLTCTIALAISVAGAVLRINASTYGFYFFAMFCLGFGGSFISMCAPKLFASWFEPQEMPIAMGGMLAIASLGTVVTNATTNMFFNGNLKSASAVGAIVVGVVLVAWVLFCKERPEGAPTFPPMPVLEPLKKALKSKNIWLLGVAAALVMGFQMPLSINYQSGLVMGKGITDANAAIYSTLFTVAGTLSNFIIPAVCAKIGYNRPTVLTFAAVGGLLTYIGWNYCEGIVLAIIVSIGAFLAWGTAPVLLGYPPMLKEIGPMNAGSASGMVTTFQMIGAFFLPSYLITPMATSNGVLNYSKLFLIGAICSVLMGVIGYLLPDLGIKAQADKE